MLGNWKKTIYRSKGYMAFIRNQPCIVDGKVPSDSHHCAGSAGTALKNTDLTCIPLCRWCHSSIHTIGRRSFEEQHNISISTELYKWLMRYICTLEGGNHEEHDWVIKGLEE